jgi:hypothetical protein
MLVILNIAIVTYLFGIACSSGFFWRAVENGAKQLHLSSTNTFVSDNRPYSYPPLYRNDAEWKAMKTNFYPLF